MLFLAANEQKLARRSYGYASLFFAVFAQKYSFSTSVSYCDRSLFLPGFI